MAIASVRIIEGNPPRLQITNEMGTTATGNLTDYQVLQLAEDALVILTKLRVTRQR